MEYLPSDIANKIISFAAPTLPMMLSLDLKKYVAYTYFRDNLSTECIQIYRKKLVHIQFIFKKMRGCHLEFPEETTPCVMILDSPLYWESFEHLVQNNLVDSLAYDYDYQCYDTCIGGIRFLLFSIDQ